MFSKSTIVGCALALAALPLAASANLITYNYTKQDSAVKITSNGVFCVKSKFTPASKDGVKPGKSEANAVEIKALCGKDPCIAQIFMNLDCNGAPVATAKLTGVNSGNHNVTVSGVDSRYNIDAQGNVVTIRMAS